MTTFSLHVPVGFSIRGDMNFFDDASLHRKSAQEIESLNHGEDLAFAEHLVLDVGVHLDARGDVFLVHALTGEGTTLLGRPHTEFLAAISDFEKVMTDIWSVGAPFREPDSSYDPPPVDDSGANAGGARWIVPGGWTILLDSLSGRCHEGSPVIVEPMRLAFAAISSHRSVSVYEIAHPASPAPYAGFLWADPVGMLYERVFFGRADDVASWLQTRLKHGSLPRRKRRR